MANCVVLFIRVNFQWRELWLLKAHTSKALLVSEMPLDWVSDIREGRGNLRWLSVFLSPIIDSTLPCAFLTYLFQHSYISFGIVFQVLFASKFNSLEESKLAWKSLHKEKERYFWKLLCENQMQSSLISKIALSLSARELHLGMSKFPWLCFVIIPLIICTLVSCCSGPSVVSSELLLWGGGEASILSGKIF